MEYLSKVPYPQHGSGREYSYVEAIYSYPTAALIKVPYSLHCRQILKTYVIHTNTLESTTMPIPWDDVCVQVPAEDVMQSRFE